MERSASRLTTCAALAIVCVGSSMAASGCGASWERSRVPFYLYGSPLIAGTSEQGEARGEPADDSTGSRESERYALDESGRAERVDDREEPPTPTPEVSTKRKQATGTQEQDASDEKTSRTERADSLASQRDARPITREPDGNRDLDYVVETMRANRISIPEKARSSIAGLFTHCREDGTVFQEETPAPGDIVFFHNTADVNDDGRNNDWYTFTAVVVEVNQPSVRAIGYRGGEVREFVMNRESTATHRRDGELVNTQLRPVREADPPYTRYLAGQLFAGYCTLLGERSDAVIMDNWQPGMDVTPPERE